MVVRSTSGPDSPLLVNMQFINPMFGKVQSEAAFMKVLEGVAASGKCPPQLLPLWQDFYNNYKTAIMGSTQQGANEKLVASVSEDVLLGIPPHLTPIASSRLDRCSPALQRRGDSCSTTRSCVSKQATWRHHRQPYHHAPCTAMLASPSRPSLSHARTQVQATIADCVLNQFVAPYTFPR